MVRTCAVTGVYRAHPTPRLILLTTQGSNVSRDMLSTVHDRDRPSWWISCGADALISSPGADTVPTALRS